MAADLWRECARWLIQCQVLPQDHKVTWPNAQVFDLAQTLRDGVLLCHLLNNLSTGCIDLKDISLRPQMSQFLCLKNIRVFLQTCQNLFRLKPSDLFDSYMLFDMTDFGKVLQMLSVLSNTSIALQSGRSGFPRNSLNEATYYNDDIYKNLEELANENDLPDELYDTVTNEDGNDIYEELCKFDRPKVQAAPTVPIEKRDYCIKELVETEKNYVEALNMIITHFLKPLKNVFRPEQTKTIFMNIEDLAEIHSGFHAELHKACTSNTSKISECFLTWKSKFIVYGEYCSSLPLAQTQLEEACCKDSNVNAEVTTCQENANNNKFQLRDLLSVPVQRVLKYHLLLKELIWQTPKSNEERPNLEKALEAMLDLSLYINEVKRDNETLQIIRDIQASITDLAMPDNTELCDYGRLLKDGELKIRFHPDKRPKSRYIFIFDKVMLMCKTTRGELYNFKQALSLNQFQIEDIQNRPSNNRLNELILINRDHSITFSMYAKTEEIKRKWMEAINMALDNTCPSESRTSDHAFSMHTFDKPTTCTVCEKLLRGVFYQGYKCSRCGAYVHKECIANFQGCGAPSVLPRPVEPLALRRDIGRAKAVKNFTGLSPSHLTFEVYDVIHIITKETSQSSWWKGWLERTGKEGLFPSDYVKEIKKPNPGYEQRIPTSNHKKTLSPLVPPSQYVNLNLETYPWFAGALDRDAANTRLESLPNGCFLIRTNPKSRRYAISINYNNQVKHIRINSDDEKLYFLAETKFFKSIVELVKWYEEHSLSESFQGLETCLRIPYLNVYHSYNQAPLGSAKVLHNFSAISQNMLSLRKGERVSILSKAGGEKGWWKGKLNDKVGYFPLAYVEEEEE